MSTTSPPEDNRPDDDDLDPTTDFQGIERLSKDLRKASIDLRPGEARYLVDTYYQQQEQRIRSNSRLTQAAKIGEPNAILKWDYSNMKRRERDLQLALGSFAANYRTGAWLQHICGVGPVISAGLLAYIDIRQAPTVGHIWNFAGLNPDVTWLGKEGAKKLVGEVLADGSKVSPEILAEIAKRLEIEPAALTIDLSGEITRAALEPVIVARLGKRRASALLTSVLGDSDVLTEKLFQDICTKAHRHPENIRKMLRDPATGALEFTLDKLTKALAKKPWCGRLKILSAFKAGECFVKVQNNERDFYGSIYRKRKDWELDRNLAKGYSDQAAAWLLRVGRSTEAYKYYKQGMLPPGHIHARARRYAVKIFLAHVHAVMFEDFHGTKAPEPYAFAHLQGDHRHYIAPPNWPGDFTGRPLKRLLG